MTCRVPRRAPAATVLLGLALAALPAARAAQTWAQLPVPAPARALLESRTRDGALHLLFQPAENGPVGLAVTGDAGGSWTVSDVSEGAAATASFDLSFDASNRTLTHVAYAGDGLVYARAVGGATTWTRATLDTAAGAGETGIAVAAQADTVAVLYRKDGALWLIRSTNDGSNWGTAVPVAPAGAGLLSLTIDTSGALHALYPLPDGTGPVYSRSADAGANWTATVVATDDGPAASHQALVLEPGLTVAAFSAPTGVRVARSTDGGASWQVQKLADGAGAALALDDTGTLHLAYLGNDGRSVKLASSVDAHSWSRETVESAPDSAPRDALVAVSGEAVFVPFVQFQADLVAAWNGGTPAPPAPVDISGDASESDVELSARLESQWYDPVADDWYFRYAYYYRNAGRLTASNVSMYCDVPAPAETVDASSWLPLSGMREPKRMTFGIGSLARLSEGRAWLTVRAPGSEPPLTELRMLAELTNDNTENDTADNAVEVRHAVPLLAPLVAVPALGGQTCRTGHTVSGIAQPGVTVALTLDGGAAGSAPIGADRSFAIGLDGLSAGDHAVSLTAEYGGLASPAQEFRLSVDPTLAADPVAIVLTDDEGRVQRLNDGQGQASLQDGWRGLRLAPGSSYTLGVASCCPGGPGSQSWSLELGSGAAEALEFNPASGRFEGTFEIPFGTAPGSRVPVTLAYRCSPSDPVTTLVATGDAAGMLVAAGRVYDAAEGKGIDDPVAGILSSLWNGRPATGLGGVPALAWLPWPAELFGEEPNPQETGPDGHAPFYPPPGRYRWVAADPSEVFEGYGTPSRVVVDGVLDPNVPLSVDEPVTRRIVLNDQPVSGRLNISEDDVVEWVNADDQPHRVYSLTDPALGTGGWDSGEIPPGGRYRKLFDQLGDYLWTDDAVGGQARLVARKLVVSPEAGTEGTDLVIIDEGFGSGKGTIEVGGTPCKVKNWNDTQVSCTIKEVLPPGIYDVVVIPGGSAEARTYASAFEAKPPVVRSVIPAIGKKGTKVRISGTYWGTKKGTVTVGGKKAKVPTWLMGPTTGDSAIEVKIPKLDPGSYDVVIEAPTGTVTLSGGFTVQ